MLPDILWRANVELVQSSLAHPFVQALGDGTVPAFSCPMALFTPGPAGTPPMAMLCPPAVTDTPAL